MKTTLHDTDAAMREVHRANHGGGGAKKSPKRQVKKSAMPPERTTRSMKLGGDPDHDGDGCAY